MILHLHFLVLLLASFVESLPSDLSSANTVVAVLPQENSVRAAEYLEKTFEMFDHAVK